MYSRIIFTISVLFFLNCFVQNSGAAVEMDRETELEALQAEFIEKITSIGDPEEVLVLAALYAGRIWEIAARELTERYGIEQEDEYLERADIEAKNKTEDTQRNYLHRQVMGMRLYYESTRAVAGILALGEGTEQDIQKIQTIAERLNPIISTEKVGMEVMVSLARGTMIMLSLMVRFVDLDRRLTGQVNEELDYRVRQTESIRAREDIHNYSKMLHWAVNYLRGGFRFIYLLNMSIGGRSAAEAASIHDSWKKHIQSGDTTSIRAMALDLTAATEASFPLVRALIRK
jgi:hypothetical protein